MAIPITIGELSRQSGIPSSAIRYYERSGLLEPSGRTEGNYRVYGPDAVGRLRFIKAAQAAGFTLNDIGHLLEIRDGNTSRCDDVKVLVESRLADLEEKLSDLRNVADILKSFVKLCGTSGKRECEVLNRLGTD